MSKVSVKRHLKELQWRLMIVALFFIAGAVLAYQFQAQLVPLLLDPLHGEKLVYLNPAGGFSFIFLISIYAGLALSLPILVQQIYSFLRPALPEAVRKKSSGIIFGSFFLMLAGIAFGYFVAVPNALGFLYGFADQYVDASLTAESYLNFMIAYTIGIGIVFQLPLLLVLIHNVTPLKPGGLLKSEKWVVLVAFIIAAIITPTPDPVNQTIMAVPIIAVYQIGVVTILLSIAKQRRALKKANKRAPLSNEQFQNLIAVQQDDDEILTLAPLTQASTVSAAITEPAAIEATLAPQVLATSSTIGTNDAQSTNTLLAIEALEAIDLDTKLETELEAALSAEIAEEHTFALGALEDQTAEITPIPQQATPQSTIATTSVPLATVTPSIAAPKQVAAPAPQRTVQPVNRTAFRSIDGIVRQRVIRPTA